MVKAIFFDLVNTLVRHDPPPEERQQWALREFNIEIPKDDLRRGFWAANDYFSREAARAPIEKRPETEKIEVALKMLHLVRRENPGIVPFEDTVPALIELRERGLVVGLVSNLDTTLDRFCPDFDLASHLDFVIVSHEVGFEKPQIQIFEAALEQAGAEASASIMVGDQYHSDMVGAMRAGIKPLWLDRDGIFDDHKDCQRIGGLMEIVEHL
jgi:putative hydrolase of the HAD superfamily